MLAGRGPEAIAGFERKTGTRDEDGPDFMGRADDRWSVRCFIRSVLLA